MARRGLKMPIVKRGRERDLDILSSSIIGSDHDTETNLSEYKIIAGGKGFHDDKARDVLLPASKKQIGKSSKRQKVQKSSKAPVNIADTLDKASLNELNEVKVPAGAKSEAEVKDKAPRQAKQNALWKTATSPGETHKESTSTPFIALGSTTMVSKSTSQFTSFAHEQRDIVLGKVDEARNQKVLQDNALHEQVRDIVRALNHEYCLASIPTKFTDSSREPSQVLQKPVRVTELDHGAELMALIATANDLLDEYAALMESLSASATSACDHIMSSKFSSSAGTGNRENTGDEENTLPCAGEYAKQPSQTDSNMTMEIVRASIEQKSEKILKTVKLCYGLDIGDDVGRQTNAGDETHHSIAMGDQNKYANGSDSWVQVEMVLGKAVRRLGRLSADRHEGPHDTGGDSRER